jgi:aldehyde dehydrogenase (NAD+)
MEQREIHQLVQKQREYFGTGVTLPLAFRAKALKTLLAAIENRESEIQTALQADLGKSASESYMCEIGLVKSEIRYMLRHLKSFAAEKRVPTPLAQFVSRSYVKPSPRGNVLIMSPWNYPFLLTVEPLVDALAAGNTAVVKPSAYSPCTSKVVEKLLQECYSQEYVAVVTGGRAENTCLLNAPFDYIFFTGSKAVGKEVLAHAAPRLTPCTLELGGKSPCIVDASAKINLAARRIVFGKFLNCGQTCVAPDYILCDASVREKLIQAIKKEIRRQYGEHPLENPNYGRIVNEKHFQRLCSLMNQDQMVWGGENDPDSLRIAPTVMTEVDWTDPVMEEEIFGPILPILTYESLEQAVEKVNEEPTPLALYMFSEDKKHIRYVTERASFGGGCVNDTIIHLATSAMGFGGCGESGMGAYHGRRGFEAFSHRKSIVDKKTFLDLPMRYQPYQGWKDKLVKIFVR